MKGLIILGICLLTLYAPIELTWVIIDWGISGEFVCELTFMWLAYLVAMVILFKVVRS